MLREPYGLVNYFVRNSLQDISLDEFGKELPTKIKRIIDECLKPESSRPEMCIALSILRKLERNGVTTEADQTGTS